MKYFYIRISSCLYLSIKLIYILTGCTYNNEVSDDEFSFVFMIDTQLSHPGIEVEPAIPESHPFIMEQALHNRMYDSYSTIKPNHNT